VSRAHAQLTPAGRLRLAQLLVDQSWPLRRAAERWSCSVTTAKRWTDRDRKHGRDLALAVPPQQRACFADWLHA